MASQNPQASSAEPARRHSAIPHVAAAGVMTWLGLWVELRFRKGKAT